MRSLIPINFALVKIPQRSIFARALKEAPQLGSAYDIGSLVRKQFPFGNAKRTIFAFPGQRGSGATGDSQIFLDDNSFCGKSC